jgi:hypothetical protein
MERWNMKRLIGLDYLVLNYYVKVLRELGLNP